MLGQIEAVYEGERLNLGGPRLQHLLCLLLLEPGRVVSSDRLIEEIWTGEPPDGAETTLRSYVSRLRSQLETIPIRGTAAGYVIDVPAEAVDSRRFQVLIGEADESLKRGSARKAAQLAANALALWRGEPYTGLADDGALRADADRLEELRVHGLETSFDAELALGNAASLIDELERLVASYPFREKLWHSLMLALYLSGRQADALSAYQRARHKLDDELGLEPGRELQDLQAAILRHEVVVPQAVDGPHNLPADVSTFVGRASEIAEIEALLDRHRVVTLTGVGGVGKTRLALEVARRVGASLNEGSSFVDLALVTAADDVTRHTADAMRIREKPGADPDTQLIESLRGSEGLIVLDNCEHVVATVAPLVEKLLAGAPLMRVLATSRVPLGANGEADYSVPPLRIPATDAAADELRQSDSVALLLSRMVAPAREEIDDEALREAARICRDLDGLPLAIELAAARSKALSLADIAQRLDDRFRFLVSWRRLTPARHQTLRQAMDWSYELLSAEEQAFFAQLSVFAGGFTLEAAAAVAKRGAVEVLDLTTRLVDASLVIADKQSSETRFRLLETVRQYAADRLAESAPAEDARERHEAYFRELAARAEPELGGEAQNEWFTRLDIDHDNLRAALSHAAESDDAEALLAFTVSLTRFWYVRGHLAEARQRLGNALAGESTVPAALRRRALTAAASVALLQGDYPTAISWAEASLDAARETGEQRLVANGLSNLGAITMAGGQLDRAGDLLREAVPLARTAGDERILALALNNLADHALTTGDYAAAEPLFEESLALLLSRGDTANVARSLFNLGAVALRMDRVDAAEARFRESLERSNSAGDKEDICWSLLGLASVAARRREGERAAVLSGAAISLLDQMGAQFKPFERGLHEETAMLATSLLGEEALTAAQERGTQLSLTQAVEYAAKT